MTWYKYNYYKTLCECHEEIIKNIWAQSIKGNKNKYREFEHDFWIKMVSSRS